MKYPGAKKQHIQTLINQIPRHRVYIEPFLGSGELFLKKKAATKNIGIDMDERIIDRFCGMTFPESYAFVRQDACEFLTQYEFNGEEFLFVDPPYLGSTRIAKKIYRHEINYEYHLRLLDILVNLDAPVMLAGYISPLYEHSLSDWRGITLKQRVPTGNSVERVWMNYPQPEGLHDYRHVGDDYRQREGFMRRQTSMQKKYNKMTVLERSAFKEWIAEGEYGHVCK